MNISTVNNINFVRASFSGSKLANVVFGLCVDNSNALFFADVERQNSFDKVERYNMNSLSSSDKHLIHNMYRSDDCFFKSAIYLTSKSSRTNTTYDYLNIFTHKLNESTLLTNAVLTNGVFYALLPKSYFGRYNIDCDIYSYISANNGLSVPNDTRISTIIYNREKIKEALEADDISLLQLNSTSVVLSNIQYNMVYEIQGNQYNAFESGNIAANTVKCKNAFNSLYDMKHSDGYVLSNARDYEGIGNCNKQVYLTYKDNVNYEDNDSKDSSPEKNNLTYSLSCQLVELLGSMNRYANFSGHKANLYSIAVYSDIFNCLKNDDIKLKLLQEVQHVIKDITDKLAPVNTQLLSAYVNELN